jgi:hypothetical protein
MLKSIDYYGKNTLFMDLKAATYPNKWAFSSEIFI